MQTADNLKLFIKKKADPELLNDMLIAERSNNMRDYHRLKSKLLKDYTDYCKHNDS